MAKEESGGKFPPLLIHSGMRIKREKGKLKRNESRSKQKNSGEKKRKGKQIESRAREREKKRVSTFSLRSTGIEPSVSIRARGKVGPRNESYAWVPKSESFVKLQEVGNFPTRVISSLKAI